MLPGAPASAQVLGSRPGSFPPGRSIYRLAGEVRVNGAPATPETQVRAGDTVETGPDGEAVFVIGGHAMILRQRSRLETAPPPPERASLLLGLARLVTGALLLVSRNSALQVRTPTATIGFRGTGWYAEASAELTYFCTCYGIADIAASADPESRATVTAQQHDRPLYIAAGAPAGRAIRDAPFINHTDQELQLIETLVGRETPFVFPGDEYARPRRRYR